LTATSQLFSFCDTILVSLASRFTACCEPSKPGHLLPQYRFSEVHGDTLMLASHADGEGRRLVLETLVPLPEDRKCFRMINGVLVERTVKEVVPALQTNSDGLKKVLDELLSQYKTKQDDMDKWKVCGVSLLIPPRFRLRL
jgi:hypothetical protein